MKMRFLIVLVFLSSSLFAEESFQCLENPHSSLTEFIEANQAASDMPKATFSYELSSACVYKVITEVQIPNNRPLSEFMEKVTNPAVNLASSDREKIINTKVTPEGNGFKQVITAKKKGFSVDILSNCEYSKKTSSEMVYECKVNPTKTTFKTFKLFEFNETVISCKVLSQEMKSCTFKTTGKAKSIPFVGNSCKLASPGAADTFEASYRLAHYLTHGDVRNVHRGDEAVSRFYQRSKDHPQIGKTSFTLKEEVH